MTGQFGDYQFEIYLDALSGNVSDLPMDYATLERKAAAALPRSLHSYIAGGAGDEATQRRNADAFARWGLIPRMLVGAEKRDMSVTVWGQTFPAPIFMAPIGVAGLVTADGHGDIAVARAAAETGVPAMFSTLMQDPLEEVIEHAGPTPSLFQLYTPKDRDLAASLVERAEKAGYRAIAVTLDTWIPGWRPRDLATGNFPQLRGHVLKNYSGDPVFRRLAGPAGAPREDVRTWAETFGNPLTWADLGWLRSLTELPIVLKGICHPDDARRAVDAGVDGVYCSNHGGRQANGGLSALELLPDVVAACDDQVPVLFDSGVRSGSDVVKALGLGATMVGIGRPYVYGLALGGVAGLVHVLRMLLAEADLLMAVNGYPDLAAVRANTRKAG
ncbi:alpha-hydroxy-acid oxidizing protein [Actinomadura madurae]|uniref:FMN-dependent dehydrogenase, includes L-lactate dehydrogenase and type II isopentenyl diphosphate isomerase n=1 Tax=Actinomadura madurae TaxID=1993 RepID=A0A1I5YN00_9ACTN|nr:alpha-hydroxy-acid oxidizing protein [Actinomadura madurae]SFQ45631.1 FMN-dependent dehydrogenase, includes L-lactate dehydrogenase and type II isopentenyl diphosphate isomerase [Actinomadura madurae]SPT52172.1 Lactate 2-monooxygenase [Actinomadura madurae]